MKRRTLKQWLVFAAVVLPVFVFTLGGVWLASDAEWQERLGDYYAAWLGPMNVVDAWYDGEIIENEGHFFLVETDAATIHSIISRFQMKPCWIGGPDNDTTSNGHALADHGFSSGSVRLLKPGEENKTGEADFTIPQVRCVRLLLYDSLEPNRWIIKVMEWPFGADVWTDVLPVDTGLLLEGVQEAEVVAPEKVHPGRHLVGGICSLCLNTVIPVLVVNGLMLMLFGYPRGCLMYFLWFLLPSAACGFCAFMNGEPFIAFVFTFLNIPSFLLSTMALLGARCLREIAGN